MKLKVLIGNCDKCGKEFKFPEIRDGYELYPNKKMSINCPFCKKGRMGDIRLHQEIEVEEEEIKKNKGGRNGNK